MNCLLISRYITKLTKILLRIGTENGCNQRKIDSEVVISSDDQKNHFASQRAFTCQKSRTETNALWRWGEETGRGTSTLSQSAHLL